MITAPFAMANPASRTAAATLGLLAAMAIATPELSAQRRGSTPRPPDPAALHMVERALRLGDRLKLTEQQRVQLESIRAGMVEQQAGHSARMMSLASEVRAGISEVGAAREALAAMREEAEASRRELRGKYDEIFTDEQKQQLRRLNHQGAWRQRGVRGRGPGWNRGRGIWGRGEMDRGHRGDRFPGWRSPGRPGR